MANRASVWSVTINNPIKADDENIALARQKGWLVEGQLEKGERTGTPHYQLMVRTGQVRFSAVKKSFPRARIEVCRNPEALKNYVNKEETRVGPLPTSQESYPSQSRIMGWFADEFELYGHQHDGVDDEQFLEIFDSMIHKKIREGYVVETIAVNPQIRAAIKRFGRSIFHREYLHRQTDRQTQEIVIPDMSITTNEEDGSEISSQSPAREEGSQAVDGEASGGEDVYL